MPHSAGNIWGHEYRGVEIDEKITDLSRKYFSLSEDVPVILTMEERF